MAQAELLLGARGKLASCESLWSEDAQRGPLPGEGGGGLGKKKAPNTSLLAHARPAMGSHGSRPRSILLMTMLMQMPPPAASCSLPHASTSLSGLCCPEFAKVMLGSIPYGKINVTPEEYLDK